MKYLQLAIIGAALAFIYSTFEPVILAWLNDLIYFPIYEAIWVGLGVGGATLLVLALLAAAGLYAFLAVTKPREARR